MKEIKVKPDFAKKEVGFLGKFGPLGEMSQEDLREYYAMVKHHNIAEDIAMFEHVGGVNLIEPVPAAPAAAKKATATGAKAKKATKAVHKQTPDNPQQAAAIHEANENGGGNPAPVSTSVTDNTAITPAP